MDYSPQGPLSIKFSRQEYWSELPFPPPGHLPNPGIELASAGGSFTTEQPGKALTSPGPTSYSVFIEKKILLICILVVFLNINK